MSIKPDSKNIVIAGAGIPGLMIALRLVNTKPDSRIVVFDRAAEVGGVYATINYANGRVFDHGMHIIYESCCPEVDDLYLEIMPSDDWHILEQNHKDIAGVFFRGKLQTYSHYVDLRSYPDNQQREFMGSVMQAVSLQSTPATESCEDLLIAQFGSEVVRAVHDPLLNSLYGLSSRDLAQLAVRLTALERVCLFDAPTTLELMKSDRLRARVAYPDQINLPPYRTNSQKGLYPKQFGMGNFVDRLKQLLLSRGVEIKTGANLTQVRCNEGCVESVTLSFDALSDEHIFTDALIWTVGWPALAHALEVNTHNLSSKPKGKRKIVFANLVFDRTPQMDRLYYFYCYDTGFATFRVTNYSSYCPAACADGTFPVCVELWPERLGDELKCATDEQLLALTLKELKAFGVIQDHQLLFSQIHRDAAEFPLPSLDNSRQLQQLRSKVEQTLPSNIVVTGLLAEPSLFFLPDILRDAFKKIAKL
jgi:protoporphyrinogen oxidase